MECGSRFFFIISDTSLRGSLFPYIIKPSDPFLKIFYPLDFLETLLPFLERVCKKPNFGNGRFARNLIEGALFGQALRLTRQNFSTMTMDDIVTLKARDFDLTEDDTLEEEPKHIGFNR